MASAEMAAIDAALDAWEKEDIDKLSTAALAQSLVTQWRLLEQMRAELARLEAA